MTKLPTSSDSRPLIRCSTVSSLVSDSLAKRRSSSPLLRSGIEARPAQRLAYLGRPPDELGRDQVLDHDDSSPAIGETGGWSSGERRLPGAEELGVWPVESADGKFEALADGLQIRLAWKVPRRRT